MPQLQAERTLQILSSRHDGEVVHPLSKHVALPGILDQVLILLWLVNGPVSSQGELQQPAAGQQGFHLQLLNNRLLVGLHLAGIAL